MNYIDLTMTYQGGMRGVSMEPARVLEKDGWNASTLHLYSHAGTHMDAPLHFGISDKTIDEFPVSRFFCDCWLADIPNCEPSRLIEITDLGDIEDKIKAGEGILFRTGWSAFAGQEKYRDELPRISTGLAKWIASRNVAMIGVEPPSVADVNNLEELTEVHRILLQADVLIVEGLCQLNQITKEKVHLIALPLKIQKGDGAPCRVVAIED